MVCICCAFHSNAEQRRPHININHYCRQRNAMTPIIATTTTISTMEKMDGSTSKGGGLGVGFGVVENFF